MVGGHTVYDSYSFLFLECVLQPKSQSLKHMFCGPISEYRHLNMHSLLFAGVFCISAVVDIDEHSILTELSSGFHQFLRVRYLGPQL